MRAVWATGLIVISFATLGAAQDIESLMKGKSRPAAPAAAPAAAPVASAAAPSARLLASWDGKPLEIYKSAGQASLAADSAIGSVKDLLSSLKSDLQRVNDERATLEKTNRELSSLVDGKEDYMREIRNGLFCSGCGKTKSEILARGETFPHSGQTVVRPTPQQVAQYEHDYDLRIDNARQRQISAEKILREAERQLADHKKRIAFQLAVLYGALEQEATLLRDAWKATHCSAVEKVRQWKGQLNQLPGAEAVRGMNQQIDRAVQADEQRTRKYDQERAAFFNQLSRANGFYTETVNLLGAGGMPSNVLSAWIDRMPLASQIYCP